MASHDQAAHRWALDDESKRPLKSFNMPQYWSGTRNTIYSHGQHFPIASFVNDANGRRVILMTTRGYSMSTSKHISHVRRAIPSGRYAVFNVNNPSASSEAEHRDNVKLALNTAAEKFASASRRRAPHMREYDMEAAQEALETAEAYSAAFGLPWTPIDLPAAAEAVKVRVAAEREEAARQRAEAEARERVRREAEQAEDAAQFATWQAGEGRLPYSYRTTLEGTANLRRIGDKLETSQGADVPWRHAVRVFQFVKLVRESGKAWKSNGAQVRVGHYRLDSIDAEGNFIAGCHRIAWAQIAELAKREGVFTAEASSEAVTVEAH